MIAVLLAAAAGQFAPPLERPMTLVTEQVREDGRTVRRFTAERRMVFRRDAGGLVAEVTLVRLDAQAEPEIVRNYRLSTGGLLNRTVRYRLDGDRVTGVEDMAAVWTAMVTPITRLTPPRDRSIPETARPGATLAALPPERQLSVLAGTLQPILAGGDAALAPGEQPVAVPDTSGGSRATLAGTRRITRDADGRVVLNTDAANVDETITLTRTRTVNPATGLALAEREMLIRRLGTAQLTTTSTTTLTMR